MKITYQKLNEFNNFQFLSTHFIAFTYAILMENTKECSQTKA